MDPLERFAAAVDQGVDLDELCALVAAHLDPGLDPDLTIQRLDDLAAEVRVPTLDGLVRWYRSAGFVGNRADYSDPANSLLHLVLDRRSGIPITLSVVMLEVGRRVGVPLAPVSMPGHFLLRDRVDPDLFVDAFDQAALLDAAGAQQRFRAVHGGEAAFDENWLAPVPVVAVIARVLQNLRLVCANRGRWDLLAGVLELRLCLPGVDQRERAELAGVWARRQRYDRAADELEALALARPAEAERHQRAATALRARLN